MKLHISILTLFIAIPYLTTSTYLEDFKELRESGADFIDRSLFIKNYFETPGKIKLCDAPPTRYREHPIMNMFKRFLQIETDESGAPLPPEKRQNPRLFFGDQHLKPLLIANEVIHMVKGNISTFWGRVISAKALQGTVPVIYVNATCVGGLRLYEVLQNLQVTFSNTFREHEYMLRVLSDRLKNAPHEATKVLSELDLEKFKNFLKKHVSEWDMVRGLEFLTRILYEHFRIPVCILIEEYDSGVHANETQTEPSSQRVKVTDKDLNDISQLFRRIFTVSLNEKDKTLLTVFCTAGILGEGKRSIFAEILEARQQNSSHPLPKLGF